MAEIPDLLSPPSNSNGNRVVMAVGSNVIATLAEQLLCTHLALGQALYVLLHSSQQLYKENAAPILFCKWLNEARGS